MPQRNQDPTQHRPGAVALRYRSHSDPAPRVTAKGRGAIAEKIIALAQEHNIPIVQNADLLMVLSKVELMDEIPEALYGVVAEILAYVYSINEQLKTTKGS
ncbi:MAG TPA: EscU/YscU/HrcU family type III secretion system export apparatus switch protein [Bacteroidota bacterium]|nr:EscU/YscU/HrcU family type III secretion system export apparatus switch protein [Bacteroidota bacterium]